MKLVEIVGKNIAARRRVLGISQKELAAKLDITQDALNRMEKGKIAPKMSRLENIANCLQCPVSYLFHLESWAIQDRAAAIAELIASVPESGQDAIVNLVAETVRIMNFYAK